MKVLIVDDNGNDRKLLRLNLERHGCEMVIEAREGREGFDLARVHRPDLIISDALMQGVDGFEFLHMIKTDEALKNIPFVFHSSVYTGSRDEELASRLGAEAFITKPKEPEEFWTEIAAVLERLAIGAMKAPPSGPMEEEREYLREYSGVVAAKLEEKVQELEEALARARATEEKLQILSSAIEQSSVSIVITDARGKIEFVNPKFTQLTGYSSEEAIGQNPRILSTGMTSPEEYRKLWETISSGNVWHGEFHNRKKNNEIFLESATIAPVKNRQGAITHYIAVKEDITERRSLENQLRQAQKMELIGTLTGGIAHDFNNILTAIIGFGNILEMKIPPDDPLYGYVTQILSAADRAANLTRSLLAFSRKQAIAVKPSNLNEIVTGMEKMLHRLIREDIELNIHLPDDTLTVLADPGQIEQVLLNLTTNARDSMPAGGTISITTGLAELDDSFRNKHGYGEPGNYALINFTDSGEGIAESVRQRIFEPFFTTKDTGKGTGLGLAVCYGIVKQHHGYIVCDSAPGKGTTFQIYLPVCHGASAVASEKNESAPPRGGAETILLAEDDEMVRNLTTRILKEFGYSIIEAQDGEEAVAKFSEHSEEIQLCLLDLGMPKKDGRHASEDIRKIRSGIKVLFMSGYQPDSSSLGGELQVEDELIRKPVPPNELLRKIREVLDRV